MTAAAWETALAVNVRAVALATAAAAREMAKQGGGRIVNITSAAARMALPNYAAYAATKAAVDSLTRSAAVALARDGIRVNSLSPGMMDTPLQMRTEETFCRLQGRGDLERFRAERTARIPLGRRTTPEEMARAVAWLAEDAPDYMTAERLNLSGGLDRD
jgi:NAD(P)-dependent dehydrogenase (short-subunit alcohol dehydrogenase family)